MPELPPIDWFRDPKLTAATPVTVTAEGRVFGHIAAWDASHIGLPGNVRPPRSRTDYGYFHTGALTVSDRGKPVDISIGHLTLDTGHAAMSAGLGEAAAHYDDTGAQVASVCAGEDRHGIWFAGAIDPGVDELRLHRLRGSAVSGDWRPIGNSLELVAALMVNTPGFPIPRARVASASPLAPLVAAGVVAPAAPPGPAPASWRPGTMVSIGRSGLVGRVAGAAPDRQVAVEVTVPRNAVRAVSALEASLRAELAARDRCDRARTLLASIPRPARLSRPPGSRGTI